MERKNGDIVSFLKQKDYKMINNNLGSGSFGKTVLLQDPFIDELFVAKMYQPEYEEIKEKFFANFLDEIKILYKLNHPNVVRIYNYYAYEKECTGYILMEYIEGQNIEDYFKGYVGLFEPISLDMVFTQLIEGFSYIEKQGIIHRDIREGNILIDNNGTVKIIDFGIGKIFEKSDENDSLVEEINRAGSDTLPSEYYSGVYTSKTDMFYLAELFHRMLELVGEDYNDFSYYNILEKMMKKNPNDRYNDFEEIEDAVTKRDFNNMSITEKDKKIYLDFANLLNEVLVEFNDKREFVTNPDKFQVGLENALENNLFENRIQNNTDITDSIVSGPYTYRTKVPIPCDVVQRFVNWYKKLSDDTKKVVLRNIISKLSVKKVVIEDEELPFS